MAGVNVVPPTIPADPPPIPPVAVGVAGVNVVPLGVPLDPPPTPPATGLGEIAPTIPPVAGLGATLPIPAPSFPASVAAAGDIDGCVAGALYPPRFAPIEAA